MKLRERNVLLHQHRMVLLEQRRIEEHIARIRSGEPSKYNTAGQAEVVATALLSEVLKKWRKRWEIENYSEQQKINGYPMTGPIEYLSQESGLNRRQIFRIMAKEVKFTGLDKAERILMAIDRDYMLKTGEIPVVPNPHWTMEAWTSYMNKHCYEDGDFQMDVSPP